MPVPPSWPDGPCPQCLETTGLPSTATPSALPRPGQIFGTYRIAGELGHGGMGTVFDAEHLESGRRVALKVLHHALDSPDVRQRFLREGRLAASINHPNSVYVFGSEEIDGMPVISMELVPGGTLAERIRREGPLPPRQAVEAILQVIAGLEAAQTIGILHRDVKPSNCFVDSDGTLKIGDFGLSLSTTARGDAQLTQTGAFLGTPVFSSPEQLRGDELDVRSDIYAVGVTLYLMLTGRTPFEGENIVRLIATVLDKPAPSPRTIRPDIPKALDRVVLRCLEKVPSARFKDYAELRQALATFSSAAPEPAALGRRFVAGGVDFLLLFVVAPGMTDGFESFVRGTYENLPFSWLAELGSLVWVLTYFGLAEGLWGASPGKALFRLRVVDGRRMFPGVRWAMVRALIYYVVPRLPTWGRNDSPAGEWVEIGASCALFALLFVTARRRNGFAGLHDLASGTRVIVSSAFETRPAGSTAPERQTAADLASRIGPYDVIGPLSGSAAQLVLADDARLMRKLWIRTQPLGTPPVASALRRVGRPGRLRWLNGRRSDDECWDAYEAPSGRPLVDLLDRPRSWREVRFWLCDLAEELQAAAATETLPDVLALDRVWITSDGRAKLLDFPAPSVRSFSASAATSESFLGEVAHAALTGGVSTPAFGAPQVPLPLHAREFLELYPEVKDLNGYVEQLRALLLKASAVSRRRRLALVCGCVTIPLVFGLIAVRLSDPRVLEFQRELSSLRQCLDQHTAWNRGAARDAHARERVALEVYIAHRFAPLVSDRRGPWMSGYASGSFESAERLTIEQMVSRHPTPTPEELADARAVLAGRIKYFEASDSREQPGPRSIPFIFLVVLVNVKWLAIPSLVSSFVFGGGILLRLLGLAIVTRDGAPLPEWPWRAVWRTLLVWSPLIASAASIRLLGDGFVGIASATAFALIFVAGAVWSVVRPERGVQDRLAGTFLVPR